MPRDMLPDFYLLTSDEDRERKAQGSVPGTYHVMAIPQSFAGFPEYTEEVPGCMPSNLYLGPLSESSHDPLDNIVISGDPNVAILNQSRDSWKQIYTHRRSAQAPESDSGSASLSAGMFYTAGLEDQISESWDSETYDPEILDHFRNMA